MSVIEKLANELSNIFSTSDRPPIDTLRWGGIGSRPPDGFVALHPQVVVEEGKQRRGKTQQNGRSNGGSSICLEAAGSEHRHSTKTARHAPEQRSPVMRGPVMLNRQGTSQGSASFLLDLSEESEDECPAPRKTNRP